MPLTLSVVRSLVVEIGEEAYAFPLAHIERMCELEAEEIVQLEGRQHFWYEGRHVGLVSAAQLLQRPESSRTEGAIRWWWCATAMQSTASPWSVSSASAPWW